MRRYVTGLLVFVFLLGSLPLFCTAEPVVSADSAILINGITGEVIWAKNEHKKRPMASTTKIMTALLLAESGHLSQTVTVTEEADRTEGSSAGLRAGETVTKEILLAGMLLASGNDAAHQTALTLAGSLPAFADRMNEKAAEIGLTESHFVTPSGLDAAGHYSTAYDMAKLTMAALSDDAFRNMAESVRVTVKLGNRTQMYVNHNRLLTSYRGCIGVKTGFTVKAGRCLVTAAERGGVRVIAVTLHDPNDWADHEKLLDYGFEQLNAVDITYQGEGSTVAVVGTGVGRVAAVYPTRLAGLDAGQKAGVETAVSLPAFVYAPLTTGQVIGKVVYSYQGRKIAEDEIYAAADLGADPYRPTETELWKDKIKLICSFFK